MSEETITLETPETANVPEKEEQSTAVHVSKVEKKESKKGEEKQILVSLEKFEALVGLTEALFNIINDRFMLGNMGNEILKKIEALKKEIDVAKN